MYSMAEMKKLPQIKEFAKEETDAFWAYDKVAFSGGEIPAKYKQLMAIAVALTTQCVYCIEFHKQAALKEGVTKAELAEAIHVAAAIRAGGAVSHGTHLFDES